MSAVLKENGQPGQLELTYWSKIVGTVLTGLLLASALSAFGTFIEVKILKSKVNEIKNDLDNPERHGVGAADYRELRDRVSRLEGVAEAKKESQ